MKTIISLFLIGLTLLTLGVSPVSAQTVPGSSNGVLVEVRKYSGRAIMRSNNGYKRATVTFYVEKRSDEDLFRYSHVICMKSGNTGTCGATPYTDWIPGRTRGSTWYIRNGNLKAVLRERIGDIKTTSFIARVIRDYTF